MLLELRDRALDFMNEGIWIADTQGRLLYANQGFSMISGYPVPEVVGQPWYFNQVQKTWPRTKRHYHFSNSELHESVPHADHALAQADLCGL